MVENPQIETRATMFDRLREMIAEETDHPLSEVTVESRFSDDLNVDSMAFVEVIVAAECLFDVKISNEQAEAIKTPGDLLEVIIQALSLRERLSEDAG